MENESRLEDLSFYEEEESDHNKTYVTVHADSFNESDFNSFLNCLDTIRESEKKRQKRKKVIKNYCVQVPYIDNSILKDDCDDDYMPGGEFEKTCDDMKSNISQMFSYFDEDVNLNYDDCDKSNSGDVKSKPAKKSPAQIPKKIVASFVEKKEEQMGSESFRDKFLRNRNKIKELGEAEKVDSKPIIRGVIKKPNAPSTPNTSLNKNQVDKIMNEFNRVKINYYSKDNFVEFTNIDYAYNTDSDLESLRSEKVGKLNQHVLSKFKSQETDDIGRKSPSMDDIEIVPRNSVKDKISMFTKLDMVIQPCDKTFLHKSFSSPVMKGKEGKEMKSTTAQMPRPSLQMNSFIKNTSAASKNQNKCFIKDINNSIRDQVEKDDEPTKGKEGEKSAQNPPLKPKICQMKLLEKILTYVDLNDINLLMELERIVNSFGMSLLHTIDGLMKDDAFTLLGNRMSHLKVETCPSIERFNETFAGAEIDTTMENIELSVVELRKIQLQLQVVVHNKATGQEDNVDINVLFMAQYESDGMETVERISSDANQFFVYFTSVFEVLHMRRVETIFGKGSKSKRVQRSFSYSNFENLINNLMN